MLRGPSRDPSGTLQGNVILIVLGTKRADSPISSKIVFNEAVWLAAGAVAAHQLSRFRVVKPQIQGTLTSKGGFGGGSGLQALPESLIWVKL